MRHSCHDPAGGRRWMRREACSEVPSQHVARDLQSREGAWTENGVARTCFRKMQPKKLVARGMPWLLAGAAGGCCFRAGAHQRRRRTSTGRTRLTHARNDSSDARLPAQQSAAAHADLALPAAAAVRRHRRSRNPLPAFFLRAIALWLDPWEPPS